MKTQLNEINLAEREKVMACFHECGHSFICHIFGGIAEPIIWENSQKNILNGEKAWLGTCKIFVEPNSLKIDDKTKKELGILPRPKNWKALLGLAGIVSECIADGIHCDYQLNNYICDAEDFGELSATDLNLIGDSVYDKFSEIKQVKNLLKTHWEKIDFQARWMITKLEAAR